MDDIRNWLMNPEPVEGAQNPTNPIIELDNFSI
jgi:hypothetical protein